MTLDEFRATIAAGAPPSDVRGAVLALWHDGRGD